MQVRLPSSEIPTYSLKPDSISGSRHFRMYHFQGQRPDLGDLLVPHRKDHYLVILVRKGGQARQWVDMKPHILQDDTLHFLAPGQLIVKEESTGIWSTGIGFTPEFLSIHDHASLADLPLLRNPHDARGAGDDRYRHCIRGRYVCQNCRRIQPPRRMAAPDANRLPIGITHLPEPSLLGAA